VFSACRCDGRRKQRGSAALVTIAQQPGRAQITDIKRQDPSPPDARRTPARRRPDIGRTHWIRASTALRALNPGLLDALDAGSPDTRRTPAGRTGFGLPRR
jgi:hypothetical protein